MSIAKTVFAAGKAAYRADRANRYALREPWELPLILLPIPAYDGPLIRIEPADYGESARITVQPYDGDVCDGASLAPDWPRGVIPAALFHDPWYIEIPAMAAAWGWTEREVRLLGDKIFATVMLRADAHPLVARLYYNAVYRLGGVFRRLSRLLPLLALLGLMAGMSGCAGGCLSPPDHSCPESPYTPPTYDKTA